jgi:hypothetical protein
MGALRERFPAVAVTAAVTLSRCPDLVYPPGAERSKADRAGCRRTPPCPEPAYQTLPRAKRSAFAAWQREQASAFLVPPDVLDALERFYERVGKWVRRADGSLVQEP